MKDIPDNISKEDAAHIKDIIEKILEAKRNSNEFLVQKHSMELNDYYNEIRVRAE